MYTTLFTTVDQLTLEYYSILRYTKMYFHLM